MHMEYKNIYNIQQVANGFIVKRDGLTYVYDNLESIVKEMEIYFDDTDGGALSYTNLKD